MPLQRKTEIPGKEKQRIMEEHGKNQRINICFLFLVCDFSPGTHPLQFHGIGSYIGRMLTFLEGAQASISNQCVFLYFC